MRKKFEYLLKICKFNATKAHFLIIIESIYFKPPKNSRKNLFQKKRLSQENNSNRKSRKTQI
jgi:hypothetical protein